MPSRTRRAAACALLCAAACTSPAPRPEVAPVAEPAAGRPLLPLVQPGRELVFRGRSVVEQSAPDQAPAPRVSAVFSRMRLLSAAEGDELVLAEEIEVATADGESASQLSRPREQRRQVFRVDGRTGQVSLEELTTAPRRKDGYGEPRRVAFTGDGFGLNAAARRAAGLATLLVPPDHFAELAAGRSVHLPLDFFLVVRDPLADREVEPARPAAPAPPRAELRVRGETRLRPAGRESYPVDQRFPVPSLPADPNAPPQPAAPDQRRELPALRVEVESRLEITRAGTQGGGRGGEAAGGAGDGETAGARDDWPATVREDRLTWLVLDGSGPHWILSWEGTVETRRGVGEEAVLRSAFLSRSLRRLQEPSLDGPGPPP